MVLTLTKQDNGVAKLTLSFASLAGNEVLSLPFDCKKGKVETIWDALSKTLGKPQCCFSLALPDGKLIADNKQLAEFIGCQSEKNQEADNKQLAEFIGCQSEKNQEAE